MISLRTAAAATALVLALIARSDANQDCPTYKKGVKTGRIVDPRIVEASGMAASARNPGMLWLHNDSGHKPRLFAVDTSGTLTAVYTLALPRAVDWEDIAIGPGPVASVDYIYIADIGDNAARRQFVTIYRVEEPIIVASTVAAGAVIEESITAFTAFELQYPDGAHDAEVLLSDPVTSDLYIITKSFTDGISGVYRFPYPHTPAHQPGHRRFLEKVGRIQFRGIRARDIAVTAGDVSPAGDHIILRTYTQALVWPRALHTQIRHQLASPPCPVRTVGIGFPFDLFEAIAYASDGRSYYTLSEGRNQAIYRFDVDDSHANE
jgi:hypothetical protein